ncbi:hypothetical protein NDR87_22205 [Nocardia sp. CDC159]|uniref:DUF2269 family protein n=1 Tax=Nocardia pulmonis TaxID=2951408 RepID=A0A9X2EAP1_9NOCA|nr:MULTISPECIES: hypothetical protein [Nocardia]MCM6776766.1 hypothetical protein [Nocardia pulmonis]MCM6789085.1 hypothetical protein [Nocardia sp. CDC159]
MGMSSRRARQLLVWLHVVTSIGWASQAVALGVLLSASALSEPGAIKSGLAHGARLLDESVLVPCANAAAFSGFLLAACTSYGYFHRRWVAVKFVLTLVQLFIGIAILSPRMPAIVAAADAGTDGPALISILGAALMSSGLAFQAWASVAKPWGRTAFAERGPRLHNAPAWAFTLAITALLADFALHLAGVPPLCAPIALIVALTARARSHRVPRPALIGAA